MGKLSYRLLLIVLPLGLLVLLTNYIVDPGNIFSSREYLEGIAKILSKGDNIDNITNYDERLLQEQMVLRLTRTPDVIVLGSSRIMEVGRDFFPGKTVLNCGVSHADIHDIMALTGLLDSLKRLPKELLLNVEPFLIWGKGGLEWQSLMPYYKVFTRNMEASGFGEIRTATSIRSYKLTSLISLNYFKASLNFLTKGVSKKYINIGKESPALNGRFSDGTISYNFIYTHPDTARIAKNARNTGIRQGLSPPAPYESAELNFVLDFLQDRGVKVKLVMLPFHPEFYAGVNTYHQHLFLTYESYFRDLAAKHQLPITGSFDASVYGLDESCFYDLYHCSKTAIKKVLTN
ncbi:hypothetical protein ACX0G9_09375 [Flavitalea flava]